MAYYFSHTDRMNIYISERTAIGHSDNLTETLFMEPRNKGKVLRFRYARCGLGATQAVHILAF